ncbi:hypothetical protein P167DRAFT_537730 [Morchella conica CCBAS932]|uniref:C2H2-type domain-containing protein n=1 Tax=Morchella conica CCBAS932 TaxID=1392247 RepID=A0A3N4KIB4_9PEZI|nr:hypothetical protein P167DRAFT_537730 [Morchella conica CCBAS932]
MISNHSHSKPNEISNQSMLPEHEDVMDHESSTEKDDGPAAQAPVLPVMPGSSVNKKVTKAFSSEDNSCGINCSGRFLGKHQCVFSIGNSLTIECWYCEKINYKTRNDFNRHFRTEHLPYDVILENMISCPVQGCRRTGERGFTRYDNLLQHRRNFHKENIPKVHVTPRMKAPKPYARKNANPNDAGPSNASN